MLTRELEEMSAYREKLRSYSTEELEDIYFHIHILHHPLRYKLLQMEMEARHLHPPGESPPPRIFNLRAWLEAQPFFNRHPMLRVVLLSLLLFLLTTLVTLAMLAPIWLFAMPLRFIGLQTAIVYFACAPVPPILGAAIGGKMGGRGVYGIWVLLGVVMALLLFNATGAPSTIIRTVIQPQGVGGLSLGGWM
jgi:hypothetical protein